MSAPLLALSVLLGAAVYSSLSKAEQEEIRNLEGKRLRELFDQEKELKGVSRKEFISQHNIPGGYQMVQQHISGNKIIGMKSGLAYASAFNVPLSQISPRLAQELTDINAMPVIEANQSEGNQNKIKFISAKGACGGGNQVFDLLEKSLIKEDSFFTHYKVKAENLIAIYADGDSMADFIIDGDIVIFDISKTDIVGGKIYLIEHPDGLRIKRINKGFKGELTLSSNNPDKNKYPDEILNPNDIEYLKIIGQFVYRQGGF